jgi:adenylate cyclase
MNMEDQCSVEFVGEKKVPIRKGQSILAAALAADIPHYHACGGLGKCTTCRVLVKEGIQWLTEPNEREQETRKKMQFSSQIRLACQTQVEGGPVQVHRIIRDETDRSMYVSGAGEEMQDIGEERCWPCSFWISGILRLLWRPIYPSM